METIAAAIPLSRFAGKPQIVSGLANRIYHNGRLTCITSAPPTELSFSNRRQWFGLCLFGSATSDESRVKWGLDPHRIAMLRAATTLRPITFDVFGFHVPDKHLLGAADIVCHQDDDLFDSHVFSHSSDCKLEIGDELWGWYAGSIGDARIEATRLIAVVTSISGRCVPALEPLDRG